MACRSVFCADKYRAVNAFGFTLIELITVIVILAVLASIGTGFVVRTMESYQSTQNRALLMNTARPALERMTRQLRGALPYSVRLINGGQCLEFMPIAAGGNYLSPVPDQVNGASPSNTIAVSPHTVEFGTAEYVSIGAMASNELYGGGAGSIAKYGAASTATTLKLNGAMKWLRNSINQRFYLLDNPQAFCVIAAELRFYEGLNQNQNSPSLSGNYSLLGKGVTSTQPFSLQMGSENRNTRIDINLTFSSQAESIDFNQRVMIRNVP
jgi:MSHA biogenesis protein MshO